MDFCQRLTRRENINRDVERAHVTLDESRVDTGGVIELEMGRRTCRPPTVRPERIERGLGNGLTGDTLRDGGAPD